MTRNWWYSMPCRMPSGTTSSFPRRKRRWESWLNSLRKNWAIDRGRIDGRLERGCGVLYAAAEALSRCKATSRHMRLKMTIRILSLLLFVACITNPLVAATPVGVFENHEDVGTVLHPGNVEYDASKESYTI